MRKIRISVRSLVEFVLRKGSLDSKFRGVSTLQEGTKAHQKVQGSQGRYYQREVFLRTEIEYKNFIFDIEGRCDGLIESPDEIIIDEIKSTTLDLNLINEDFNPVHWGQAKLYGFIYCLEEQVENISIQLTYFNIDSETIKIFKLEFTYGELELFVYDLLEQYLEYANLILELKGRALSTAQELKFPFIDYRRGQRELAIAVYKTIVEKKRLFVKAPTGIGKTISTLFPALKAIGENKIERIFYLTAKTITKKVAEDTCQILLEKDLDIRVLTITAKEKTCFKEKVECNKDYCEYANGYYERLNAAVIDILRAEKMLNREVIAAYAKKHSICPFEYSLDLMHLVECVICDYNYIFDPKVSLRRLTEDDRQETCFLVDEAHNLNDRAREMFSAVLDKNTFLNALELLEKDKIIKDIEKIYHFFWDLEYNQGQEEYLVEEEEPEKLILLLTNFVVKAEKWLTFNQSGLKGYEEVLKIYFDCQAFLRISKLYSKSYLTYYKSSADNYSIKLFCVDPSELLAKTTEGQVAIYFSATLIPLRYYKEILGGQETDYCLSLESPFKKENLQVFVQNISTRYKDREQNYKKIAASIIHILQNNTGNYIVFFPSYFFLQTIYELILEEETSLEIFVQEQAMSEQEKELFLEKFRSYEDKKIIGFAVLGGAFSEGVDLRGDRLNGTIIVGVGLPQISQERDLLKDYYEAEGKNGYLYSYIIPGISKVLQAGGRVIRTEDDKGSIFLLDDRYLHDRYQEILPSEWKSLKLLNKY